MDTDNQDDVRKGSHRASEVWKYMTKIGEKAECNICGTHLCRKNGGTSGLRKHLLQIHKLGSYGSSSVGKRMKPGQLSTDEKKKLDSLIIKCIIEDGRSFVDMRRPGLLKVLNHLVPGTARISKALYFSCFAGYTPPFRHTVQRRLHALHASCKQSLIKELAAVGSLAVTYDFWSDKRLNSYICLTGHYITARFEFVSKIISFAWFDHRHYASHISNTVREKLKELHVYEKTTTITTDGASNMTKMFESLRPDIKRSHCELIASCTTSLFLHLMTRLRPSIASCGLQRSWSLAS